MEISEYKMKNSKNQNMDTFFRNDERNIKKKLFEVTVQ